MPDLPPPWLENQVYGPKRQRTITLVTQAIDHLRQQREAGKTTQPISLASIAQMTKELDAMGRGVSESAILTNAEARAYYEQYRTTHAPASRTPRFSRPREHPHIKSDRDITRVQRRYSTWTKAALIQRLLTVEQEYAALYDRWLALQDQQFGQQLGMLDPSLQAKEG